MVWQGGMHIYKGPSEWGEGKGGNQLPPPPFADLGRSVNPTGGQIMTTSYYLHPWIFKPSYGLVTWGTKKVFNCIERTERR